jgi:hypothetical protein
MKIFLPVLLLASHLYLQQPDDNKAFFPDTSITTGAIIDTVDTTYICKKGYSASVRNVPLSRKDSVYSLYNIKHHAKGEYEIDHLISLELGGSNEIKNLWPESYLTEPWNAHKKDRLENRLHRLVCIGKISLKEAQYEIAHD